MSNHEAAYGDGVRALARRQGTFSGPGIERPGCGACAICERIGVPVTCALDVRSVGPVDIAVCGLSYRTAPLELLEGMAFTAESHAEVLRQLTTGEVAAGWLAPEALILSTCNRVELYVAMPACSLAADLLARFIAAYHGVPLERVAPHLYTHIGEAAARHLFAVASGLDSMILGEPQILGQVRQAFDEAMAQRAAGPVLAALFRRALETGKRVRSETGISQGAASVSYAAVEMAARRYPDLSACRTLIIGAGKTGQLTAECLIGRGVQQITVINRSYENASALARQWDGQARPLEQLDDALTSADLVISCTNAPGYVVTEEGLRRARAAQQPPVPLLLVDIAVPRDIDPAVTEIPGVQLYNMDDLQSTIEANLEQRQEAARQAEAIVADEVAAFRAWFQALGVAPLISDLRGQAETIRQRELREALQRLPGLPKNHVAVIEMLTQRIVNQLLHEPTVRLKEHACQADGPLYAEALRDLFALGDAQAGE